MMITPCPCSAVHRLDCDRPAAVHRSPAGCRGGYGDVLRAAKQGESPRRGRSAQVGSGRLTGQTAELFKLSSVVESGREPHGWRR